MDDLPCKPRNLVWLSICPKVGPTRDSLGKQSRKTKRPALKGQEKNKLTARLTLIFQDKITQLEQCMHMTTRANRVRTPVLFKEKNPRDPLQKSKISKLQKASQNIKQQHAPYLVGGCELQPGSRLALQRDPLDGQKGVLLLVSDDHPPGLRLRFGVQRCAHLDQTRGRTTHGTE